MVTLPVLSSHKVWTISIRVPFGNWLTDSNLSTVLHSPLQPGVRGFNTFILSVMPYTISHFGLTTADLNRLRQAAARSILKRHWLEAEILPYVLRYFGIATLLDPALAATGLYLREGNPVEDLCYQPGREECGNARQKSVVLALMDLWSPFLGLEELVGAVAAVNGPIPKRLNALKRAIISRMVLEAKSRITKKIYNEGWSGGISPRWVTLLVQRSLLSMRGTRHQQKCGTCGLPGGSFLHGYYHPPLRIMHPLSWSECLGTGPMEPSVM